MSIDAALALLPNMAELLHRLDERLAVGERAVTAPAPAPLESLSAILGCSADAARRRIGRDPGLRAIGIPVGRSLRFRRAEVEALLRERGRSRRKNGGCK